MVQILRWKRNRIEIQNLARLELEDELRTVLRHKHLKKVGDLPLHICVYLPITCHCIYVHINPSQVENTARVRFRKVQFDRKVTEQEERRRAAVRGDHEREVGSITVSTVSTVSIDTIVSTHHI